MRPLALLLAALACGCSIDNPFFEVTPQTASTGAAEDTGAAATSTGPGESGGESATTTSSSASSSSGEAPTTGAVEPASSSGETGATTLDTSTGDSSTGALVDTSSSSGSSDGESSSTGAGLFCGDNMVTGDEQCDDGNSEPADGCENNCRFMFAVGEHSVASAPVDLAIADIDGDGKPDVVVGHANKQQGGPDLSVGLGGGDGSFAWQTQDAIGLLGASRVLVGRFDADELPDVVAVPVGGGSNLTLWINTSTPGKVLFAAAKTIMGPPMAIYVAARTADLNVDGLDDLLFVSSTMNKLFMHKSLGGGTFSPPISYTTAALPLDLAVAPLIPGDMLPDVLVAHQDAVDDVTALKGDGKGALVVAPPHNYCTTGAIALRSGDADQGGPEDLAVACQSGGMIVLAGHDGIKAYERTMGPGLPALVDLGIIDLYGDDADADLLAVAAGSKQLLIGVQVAKQFAPAFSVDLAWAPGRASVGDLNGDDAPDVLLSYPFAGKVTVMINQTRMPPPASE